MLWCEVEDEGNALRVQFGPMNVMCGMGHVVIPFDQIKSYRPAKGGCETCGGYGIGRVNICVSGGLRQHALCGICCKQSPVVIEYKETQKICRKGYKKIMIALEREDVQEFMRMMDRKFGIDSRTSTIV